MTWEDIKNKLETPNEEIDENKLTLSVDLRTNTKDKYEEVGLTADYIYTETLNALVDEYIESFLHLYRTAGDYPWEGNKFEAAIVSNLCSELSKVKEHVIRSLFNNDDELIDYLKKKINIKVYV